MIPAPPPEEEETEEEVEESPWYAKFFGSSEESSESAEEDKGDGMLDEPEEKFVAERCAVERGLVDTKLVEILSGVEVGDDIVVVGQSNLRDGARIRTAEMSVADSEEQADGDSKGQEDAE